HSFDLLYLHSFPTRRSSDLVSSRIEPEKCRCKCVLGRACKSRTEFGELTGVTYLSLPSLEPEGRRGALLCFGDQGSNAGNAFFEDRKSTRLNSSHVSISYAV